MAWGQTLGGIAGSIAGSFLPIPGVGTAIGGAIGSGLGTIGDEYVWGGNNQSQGNQKGSFWGGTPAGVESVNPYYDWQQKLFQQLGSSGMNMLQNPYQDWQGLEQNARDQFYQQVVPSLAERFTTATRGNLSSPAFASQLGAAGAQLSGDLAAQRALYGQQNRQQGLSMLAQGLVPQQQFIQREAQPGFGANLATSAVSQLAPHVGAMGMRALGGYMGAKAGEGGTEAKKSIVEYLKAANASPSKA